MVSLDGIIFSLQKTGGVSVYFSELCRRIIRSNYNCEISVYQEMLLPNLRECSDVVTRHIGRFAERYRRCVTSPSATLFHSSYYRLPQSNKIPAITTVHDFTYERFKSGPKRWVHSSQKYKAIREAAAVICVSENTRKDLLEFMPDVPEEKVRVVYNGAGDCFFPLEIDSSIQSTNVLFVGSRFGYKNFEAAVNALALFTDVELICVGGGAFTVSEQLILEEFIPGRFRHEGLVSDERLNYLYNNAICLLYPSSYEGFGIPVIEAMRAGCPVVALNLSSIPEVSGDAAILLDAADPGLLAKAIEQLAENDFRQEIRQKGILQSSRFSWDTTFNQTIKVYEEVLGYALPRNTCIGSCI